MDYVTALQSLMELLVDHIETAIKDSTEIIKNQLRYWIGQQALYIKALFTDLGLEVELLKMSIK